MKENTIIADLATRGEDAMRELIEAARSGGFSNEDVAELAQALAGSGAQLPRNERAADVASTGGPSSLSTLMCPLHLRRAGLLVPTLGVPGRPAGGVDVLGTIPGFDASLEPADAEHALERFGLIHLLADERWAPLDAELFAYRQREGAQAIPALVIASILSKKLASGAVGAGLEIRVAPHGNFGVDLEQAKENAHRYNAVAELLGLRGVCFLTDGTRPFQPYIGRGEALVAVHRILTGAAVGWLDEHDRLCRAMANGLVGAMEATQSESDGPSDLREAFEMLLAAHGAEWPEFETRVEAIDTAPRIDIRADRAGVVVYDLGRLRDLLIARQRADGQPVPRPPDPAGAILHVRADTGVETGAVLMSVRVPAGEDELAAQLGACAAISPAAAAHPVSTLEVI